MSEQTGLVLPASVVDVLPSMVRSNLAQRSSMDQQHFIEEYNRKKKSVGMAYLAYFIGGWHYGYLGKWGMNLIYWGTLGGLFMWMLLDLFRMSSLVQDYNKDVAMDVLRNLQAVS